MAKVDDSVYRLKLLFQMSQKLGRNNHNVFHIPCYYLVTLNCTLSNETNSHEMSWCICSFL